MGTYLGDIPIGVVVSIVDEHVLNVAYAKQTDLLNDVNGDMLNEEDYTDAEIERLEKILVNLTEGEDGEI